MKIAPAPMMMKSLKMMKNRFNSALPFAKRWWALAFREMEKERETDNSFICIWPARAVLRYETMLTSTSKKSWSLLSVFRSDIFVLVLWTHKFWCASSAAAAATNVCKILTWKRTCKNSFLEFFLFFESSQFQWINNVRMWWILRCRDEGSVCWPTFIDVRGTMISGKGTTWCFLVCVHLMLLLTLLRWFTIHGD